MNTINDKRLEYRFIIRHDDGAIQRRLSCFESPGLIGSQLDDRLARLDAVARLRQADRTGRGAHRVLLAGPPPSGI